MRILRSLYVHIISLVCLVFLSSCSKDWLEAKSDDRMAVPATLQDFRAMMDNVNMLQKASTPGLGEIAADNHIYTENTWSSMKNSTTGNAYIWKMNVPFEEISHWKNPHIAILSMNIVIEGTKKLLEKGEKTSNINSVLGEALFMRSKIIFDLSQVFVPVYDPESENERYGMPLRLSSDITLPSQRSTIKETYNQVTSDLLTALDLLPQTSDVPTRANAVSAHGLLARIYLSMRRYDSALYHADAYLHHQNVLYDYNNISPSATTIGINPEISYLNFTIPSSLTTFLVEDSFYNRYAENDLRKTVFFRKSGSFYAFKGAYSNSQADVFSGVATDEVYLIKAECLARKNRLEEAMQILNSLLKARYKTIDGISTYVDQTANTETEALSIILLEREKQLILRGVRWSDLRRLNKDPRFAKTITRTIGGNTYVLKPNQYSYTFPIPLDIINFSGIKQNPGWE